MTSSKPNLDLNKIYEMIILPLDKKITFLPFKGITGYYMTYGVVIKYFLKFKIVLYLDLVLTLNCLTSYQDEER